MPAPRLWSWNLSPFAGKVRIAFAEKGVTDYELLEIHPVKRPTRLGELNVANRVPVLEIGDVAVRESTPICEWIEETYDSGLPLWPSDAAQRARGRGLLRWVDDELVVNFFPSFRKEGFGLDPTDPPDYVDILRQRFSKRLPKLELLLGQTEGTWLLGGDEPSLADLGGMPLAVRLVEWKPELQPDPDELPKVAAWFDALRARPSASEVDRKGERVIGPE